MAGIRNGLMHRSIDVPTLLTGLCEREPFRIKKGASKHLTVVVPLFGEGERLDLSAVEINSNPEATPCMG